MKKGARILIVEEDRTTRTILEMALAYSGSGHRVYTAPNGQSALMQLGIVRPDLIILDLSPPEQDGWETLRLVRDLSAVPIIALASAGEADTLVNSLVCGADYCLTKPLGLRELHARVRALLRREVLASQGAPLQ